MTVFVVGLAQFFRMKVFIVGIDAKAMGTRLSLLMGRAELSEAELGRQVDLPRATINRLVQGITPDPRASTLKAISEFFNITVDQLIGKQPIVVDDNDQLMNQARVPVLSFNTIANWENKLNGLDYDNYSDWVTIDADEGFHNSIFAMKVFGDSMWPQFPENATLIIDPNRVPQNRNFVIVYSSKRNEPLFRQIIIEGNLKILIAINTVFPKLIMEEEDQIIGTVIHSRFNLA